MPADGGAMKRKLTIEEVKLIERKRYDADYNRLMREPPRKQVPHGYGPSLFEQYELQSATR